jgi:transposase
MGKSITDLSSVTTVGLDLAKHVFQVHGVDASGRVVVAKAIRRNKLLEFFASLPPCLGSSRPAARGITGRAS